MAPLLIGLFIFTAATAVGTCLGRLVNPARSLDPVLYDRHFHDIWIYLVGPLLGGVVGGAVWTLFRQRSKQGAATNDAAAPTPTA